MRAIRSRSSITSQAANARSPPMQRSARVKGVASFALHIGESGYRCSIYNTGGCYERRYTGSRAGDGCNEQRGHCDRGSCQDGGQEGQEGRQEGKEGRHESRDQSAEEEGQESQQGRQEISGEEIRQESSQEDFEESREEGQEVEALIAPRVARKSLRVQARRLLFFATLPISLSR